MKNDIKIDIDTQSLKLINKDNGLEKIFKISSSRYGVGQKNGSFCPPLGKHLIRAKIGNHAAINSVFVKRRFTGEIFSGDMVKKFPDRDWILTRIMWLSGCEIGFNRLGDVDTMRRYIYIHGAPDTVKMGFPGSIGCIRMRNCEIVELFKLVDVGTQVTIV